MSRKDLEPLGDRITPTATLSYNGGHVLLADPAGVADAVKVYVQNGVVVIYDQAGITKASGFPAGWSVGGGGSGGGNIAVGPKATVLDLTVDTGGGDDVITVMGSGAAAFPLYVAAGDGDDAVNLQGAGPASWAGGVFVDGGAGADTLTIQPAWQPFPTYAGVETVVNL